MVGCVMDVGCSSFELQGLASEHAHVRIVRLGASVEASERVVSF